NRTLWNPATTTTATYTLFDNSVTGYSGTTGNVKTTVSPFVSADDPTLLGCSPAVNAGLNSAAGLAGVNSDLAGNPRIFEGRVDMGAYEYQAAQGLAITVPSVNTATVGTAFSQSFTALGETAGSTSYSLASGSLPPGLILASNGTLSGTPTQAGSFSITVNATNGNCTGVSAAYVLEVASNTPIRYVVAGATGSGNSWTDASGDLQSQIDYVGAEQVWVAAGTYNPSKTDRSVSFSMKNGVPIYGGFEGTETDLNQRVLRYPLTTILSGEIGDEEDTDNSYHVIRNAAGLTNSAVLDGFMITGGNASGGIADDSGGGMINDGGGENNNCSPLIRNCLFANNRADNGGGAIYNGGYTNGNSNPTIVNCAFQNNAASKGGAIFNDGSINGNSNPSIINCSFQGNLSPSGGAIGNVSYRGTSRPVLTNCIVWGNGGSSTFNNQQGAFILTSYSLFESTVTGYNGGTGNLTTTTSPFVRDNNTRLRANAEAIDAGDPNSTSAVNGATDLAGNPRFGGGRIDMGAFEFDAAALPVSLVSFTAQVQPDQTVLLKWQTAAEWNNKGYLIERSKDLKNFESVGQVSDVGGSSNLSQGYRFIDTNPYQGTSYYRLKQVDLDGSIHTYSAKSVIIEGNYGVYPNPVVGQQFTLNLDEPTGAILRLYSVTGREISFTHSEISSGSTLIKPGSKLTSGIYLLSVEERGNVRVYRLVVQ
ncbi:choice-of-anchor Q domain-containing protein, partial [Dyadobacter sp.]|uniref:choice-of-anchor Q domain-containing protein n=1 Tax=Dyadobacter sp. TaxID=1914288 RepID=UPI003F71214D